MIFTEQIMNDEADVYLTRQNDDAHPKWYGTCLTWTDMDGKEQTADNEQWIFKVLLPSLDDKRWSAVGKELNVAWDKKAHKQLRKVLREAVLLDWFDNTEDEK